MLDTALGRAALFPLGRTGRGRHHRGRCAAAGDIGGPAAERGVQRVGVQLAQHPAEGPFAGHQEPAGPRVTAGPQTGQLSCEARAAHCQIAVTESPPTTSVAHAASASTTTNSWRRPRRRRRSGTCDSLATSDGRTGPRPGQPRPQLPLGQTGQLVKRGLGGQDTDTSAAPGTNFRL